MLLNPKTSQTPKELYSANNYRYSIMMEFMWMLMEFQERMFKAIPLTSSVREQRLLLLHPDCVSNCVFNASSFPGIKVRTENEIAATKGIVGFEFSRNTGFRALRVNDIKKLLTKQDKE